jgi:hypothetical protein
MNCASLAVMVNHNAPSSISGFVSKKYSFDTYNEYSFYMSSVEIQTSLSDKDEIAAASSSLDEIIDFVMLNDEKLVKPVVFFDDDGLVEISLIMYMESGESSENWQHTYNYMDKVGEKALNSIFESFVTALPVGATANLKRIWFQDCQSDPMVRDFVAERARWNCVDCQVNTSKINEYYSVNDAIHEQAGLTYDESLCIGCLEKRIGRRLYSSDFREAPLNWVGQYPYEASGKSERLINRIVTSKKQAKNENFYDGKIR